MEQVLDSDGVEAIVAAGGSEDGTVETARAMGAKVVASDKGIARQMNAGAAEASGEILLFLHADTRLPAGYAVPTVRRALNLLLFLSRNERAIDISDPAAAKPPPVSPDRAMTEEIERLRTIISVLSFDPLSGGVRSRMDALHVLGFAPSIRPSRDEIRTRFRALAAVHHPDGGFGNHQRMSQLNAAMEILGGGHY